MKRSCKIICLLLSLVAVLGSLVGCSSLGFVTDAQLEQLLNDRIGGATVEGGDNNYITIQTEGGGNLALASKALLSAVSIYCSHKTLSTDLFGRVTEGTATSAGSGVIYKLDKERGEAYVITNYHVVYNSASTSQNKISDDIYLFLYGQEDNEDYAIPASYVGGSMQYDLAVLKVEDSRVLAESNAVAAELASSYDVAVLDTAIAVGNPEGHGISVTVGYVNVDSEYVTLNFSGTTQSQDVRIRVMRIDTAVNSGNSGGGLYNASGELIGIVNAKMTDSENIGYAIPLSIVKGIADNVLAHCDGVTETSPQKATLGITLEAERLYTVVDAESGRIVKREDVVISEVASGSLAAGVLEEGDRILSVTVDGVTYEATRIFSVIDAMLNARANSTVTLTVRRSDAMINVNITIPKSALKDC